VLDANGDPSFISDEKTTLKHYRLLISSVNVPADVYSVQYQLHPSYINNFRIEDEREKNFSFKTTAYGDYSISATFLGKTKNHMLSCIVSKALEESHGPNPSEKVAEAIRALKMN
jgi:hypothetical protein